MKTNRKTQLKPNQWCIGIYDWIIQDGNYPDFNIGQSTEFALEFYSKDYLESPIKRKKIEKCGHSNYQVTAQVIYISDDAWILDFGLRAYSSCKPPSWLELNSFVTAEIYLGVDSYDYFEFLHQMKEIPPLIYSWRLDSIFINGSDFHESVNQTDAWNDYRKYESNISYELICTKNDSPPSHKFISSDLQWIYEKDTEPNPEKGFSMFPKLG